MNPLPFIYPVLRSNLSLALLPSGFEDFEVHKGSGQILICTAGGGWYQEEGKEPRELKAVDVVVIPQGVKHWRGAEKGSWFSHISLEVPGENCYTNPQISASVEE